MATPRNRRSQSGALRLVPALKTAVLVLLIATAAVGYVLLIATAAVGYVMEKNKLFQLSRQITEREARLEKLQWENRLRENQLSDLLLPQKLAERVRDMHLGLGPAQQTQMVWLVEPGEPKRTNQMPAMLVLGK